MESTGTCRIHKQESGAMSVYIDREIGKHITLPAKTTLKVVWNDEIQQITITKL